MRPTYKTFSWLEIRWTTAALLRLTEQDIENRTAQVERLDAENQRAYFNAKLHRDDEQREFKRQYPRRHFVRYKIDPPPDLIGTWKRLLTRRNNAIGQIYKQRAEKRETFLGRMTEGKARAMHRREREVRRLINGAAKHYGLELTEKETDKRLAELLEALKEGVQS